MCQSRKVKGLLRYLRVIIDEKRDIRGPEIHPTLSNNTKADPLAMHGRHSWGGQ